MDVDQETKAALEESRQDWKAAEAAAEARRRAHVETIRAARSRYSFQAIANVLGVSKARVAQIANGD